MGENLTIKQRESLEKLKRLCLLWSKFTEVKWQGVHVIVEQKEINIIWYQMLYLGNEKGGKQKYFNYSFKHFPIKKINAQINEYKGKIGLEFRIRHLTEAQKDIERENDKSRRK